MSIPKHRLTALAGVSGSGKSTLAVDVLYNECQRQYLEAMGFQGIKKPRLERMRHAVPAVVIQQGRTNRNPRSTLGTATSIYTELRMLFEKLAAYECPHCHQELRAFACREETVKRGADFEVYHYCEHCGARSAKLTRTEFSFNTKEGACPECEGMGTTLQIDDAAVLRRNLSIRDGAVALWQGRYAAYQADAFHQALAHYGIEAPADAPVDALPPAALDILLYGVESEEVARRFPETPAPRTVAAGKFEGVHPALLRRLKEKQGAGAERDAFFTELPCPACRGERLMPAARAAHIRSTRLPQLSALSLEELLAWLADTERALDEQELRQTESYLRDLRTKIQRLIGVGLGYLQLDRPVSTLSGGEAQRVRLAAALESDITDILYILDEPTMGLHARDTEGMVAVLRQLVDKGNTVLVIEHDADVLRACDHIIEIGPGAGAYGGEVVFCGTFDEMLRDEHSVTGAYLRRAQSAEAGRHARETVRPRAAEGAILIRNARMNNLRGLDADIPAGLLTGVCGVSGSGKSSLVFGVLAEQSAKAPAQAAGADARLLAKAASTQDAQDANTHRADARHGETPAAANTVSFDTPFDQVICVRQTSIARSRRSNAATFTKAYDEIRKLLAAQPRTKELGLSEKHFSFNTAGGRCERCEGLGTITSNMLFFEDVELECPACQGRRFREDVLSVSYRGASVFDILNMEIGEAAALFSDHAKLTRILGLLQDVGLGYVKLGQSLTTLSGGEAQRLKLARDLLAQRRQHTLFLIDEPTVGLHPRDIEHFCRLLHHMVDAGNTVVVVEHNLQLLAQCDHLIELGPEGGLRGGALIAAGTPAELANNPASVTGPYLAREQSAKR